MPVIYDGPIGPTQSGAPLSANQIMKNQGISSSMTGPIPLPNLTGGSAGPSGATNASRVEAGRVYVNNSTGGFFWLFMFGVIGGAIWYYKGKK